MVNRVDSQRWFPRTLSVLDRPVSARYDFGQFSLGPMGAPR
jgi:hypothetical protein